ncbi:MAG: hypothetical protein L0H31_06555, partial [Nocardioidaceae bacterium]|nr:hypothetical protein [Nocardioidaceae bacterium]
SDTESSVAAQTEIDADAEVEDSAAATKATEEAKEAEEAERARVAEEKAAKDKEADEAKKAAKAQRAEEAAEAKAAKKAARAEKAADREPLKVPELAIYPAAALTGLVVGVAMVLFTWLSLRGCEAVRGTSSCGGGPGLILLIATFVLCVLIGRALLKAFEVPDPGSSSFLAVGMVAAIALLFFIDFIDAWPMIILIPLMSVAGFLASAWVTKTFVEPTDT